VTLADFTQAIERIVAGIEKKQRLLADDERRLVAYHELGHAASRRRPACASSTAASCRLGRVAARVNKASRRSR
jgi:hypothetical protein